MIRRHVIMFAARFADAVARGEKRQTIRPTRKRAVAVGDALDLRAWSGLPYRSKQVYLTGIRACVQVGTVEIFTTIGGRTKILDRHMVLDGIEMSGEERDRFAQADGFSDFAVMSWWFMTTHGLPFNGVLIRW